MSTVHRQQQSDQPVGLNKRDIWLIVTLKRNDDDKAKDSAEKAIRDIRRATRRQYSAEEKIRIVLEGLRGEDSIAVTSFCIFVFKHCTKMSRYPDTFCVKPPVCICQRI